MVIVYRSDTGYTQEYAEMLGKAEKRKVYSLEEAKGKLDKGTEVFYMGPLMAGHIKSVDQAVKSFTVKGVCAVGMSMPEAVSPDALGRANYAPGAAVFYLQGGYDPKRLSWLQRRMVNMATKSIREHLQSRGSRRTPQEQAMLDMLLKGGSFVAFQNLELIRAWLSEQP